MPEFLFQPQIYLAVGAFLCLSIAFGILKRLVKFAITCTMLLGFGIVTFLMISEAPQEDLRRIREKLRKGKETVAEVREAVDKADEAVEAFKKAVDNHDLEEIIEAVSLED